MTDYNTIRRETTKKMHESGKMQHYLWTKTLLLKKISEARSDLNCSKLSVKNLRDISLTLSDELYNVQYYEFNPVAILNLTQDDINELVNGNKERNKNFYNLRKEQGKQYEAAYKAITKKYNLNPKYTEWNQQRRVQFELAFIKSLEKKYMDERIENITIQEFVYKSIKSDLFRRKRYHW